MNKFDLVILLIVLVFMLIGYYRGLVKSVLSVVQYFAVIFLAVVLAPEFSKILIEMFGLDSVIVDWAVNNKELFNGTIEFINEEILKNIAGRIVNVISVIVLFIIFRILFAIIVVILNKVANLPIISVVNKLGGLLVGSVSGILVVYLLILIVKWLPFESLNSVRANLEVSFLGNFIDVLVPEVATEVISMIKISV